MEPPEMYGGKDAGFDVFHIYDRNMICLLIKCTGESGNHTPKFRTVSDGDVS